MPLLRTVDGGQLSIAYERHGTDGGWPVILLHGFPYDPRCFDSVAMLLASEGAAVFVPYLRGFGPTRYLSLSTFRSGQQAALAQDLIDLISALELSQPIVAGFDWGGRAACVASMLWPEQIGGLVTVGGYNVHDVARMAVTPEEPSIDARFWYQWYLHSERGRAGLDSYRRELTRQLWEEWSPNWSIPAGAFEASAPSFDNPDFVDTVVHSYRHRYGLVAGDPAHEAKERTIATLPAITVPTIVLDATADPLEEPEAREAHRHRFPNLVNHLLVDTGHNPPQESPALFADQIISLRRHTA